MWIIYTAGIFELPVTCLCDTPSPRLIWSLDRQFLKHLKEKIAEDPSSLGVPPIAVLCKDAKDAAQFSKRLKGVYKYEVLGGQHTSKARIELHKEHPDNPPFATILAEVYAGLSDDEALRLASRHNVNGHFIHKMTHRDYVSCNKYIYSSNTQRVTTASDVIILVMYVGGSLPIKAFFDGKRRRSSRKRYAATKSSMEKDMHAVHSPNGLILNTYS